MTAQCQPIAHAVKTLVAIKGVGAKTAAALIALMPELGSIPRRQAASPRRPCSPPKTKRPDRSLSANPRRKTRGQKGPLMAALAARKHNPNLKVFYERLVLAGKKPLVAIN